MRVGLDVTQAAKTRGRGIARYIRQVLPPLDEQGLELTLCIRSDRVLRRSLVSDLAPGSARAWLPVSAWLTVGGLDLFHSFGNHLPSLANTPLTFTVHDFRSLDRPINAKTGKSRLRRNIERAAGIICLTRHGEQRLRHHFPNIDPSRISVIPHGVDHAQFRRQDLSRAQETAGGYGLARPFVLQLGSWFEHKNLELSIRGFARSEARREGFQLAFIGGGASESYQASLNTIAKEAGVADRLSWIENVPGKDLPLLLTAASCLLQPSRYEGFALPILEAMATGTPGVVSDSSCLPEVSGGVWPVCGQSDEEAFAVAIDRMVLGTPAREAVILAGLQHASHFTWEQTAQQTAAFFRRIHEYEN